MNAPPLAGLHGHGEATPQADAVLLIHVTEPPVITGVAAWWRHLRDHCLPASAPGQPPTLELRVQDRQGRCVGHLNPGAAVNRLVLPGGPYLVTARQGNARRGYYLSLAPGRESRLFVDLSAVESGATPRGEPLDDI